jgi:hypothetical protein
MLLPQSGTFFPIEKGCNGTSGRQTNGRFVEKIALALKRSVVDNWAGVKTEAGWTGAHKKAVKNWFSATYGPSGTRLIALARHADEVLCTFLTMAGRKDLMVAIKLAAAEEAIADLLDAVRQLAAADQTEQTDQTEQDS